MFKQKIIFSVIALTFALVGTIVPCAATEAGAFDDKNVPAYKTSVESYNPSGGVSVAAKKSETDEFSGPHQRKVDLKETASGSCGPNCSWSFNANSGNLIISGSGDMTSAPWLYNYTKNITSVKIENCIKRLFKSFFLF